MRQLLSHIVSLVLLAWVLLACNSRPEHAQTIDQLPAIYPDYIGVTIPVGIAPLNFSMADDDFTDIDVEIKGKKGGNLHANGSFADFDIDDWHQLLEKNKGSLLTVSIHWRNGASLIVAFHQAICFIVIWDSISVIFQISRRCR